MITGFNTDIEHDGVIYHVQTEDKGVETPLILSLVYNRGTILASKRTPYEDLIQNGLDEKILAERLQKQHKLLCAAVRAGRIEELIKMTARDAAAKRDAKQRTNGHVPVAPIQNGDGRAEVKTVQPPPLPVSRPEPPPASVQELKKSIQAVSFEDDFGPAIPQPKETFIPAIPQPKEELIWDLPLEIIDEDLIVDESQIIEAETILSADAVEIISDLGNSINPRQEHLEIRFINETAFRAGERKTLNILVYRGAETHFVGDAQVMVKVLGSSFRPLIFHARTNERGVAVVHLQLPQFRSGRGAILVRAIHAGEEAELRQIVRQN
ncbi:MAG: hypothetical protein JSS81_03335 [Acidobacteria bacterium]|nr:hypothetical protein [Acidobacteriota bacterium]